MAAEGREPGAGLIGQLIDSPGEFELFQAIRIADDHVWRMAKATGLPPPAEIGTTAPAEGSRPTVRFQGAATLGFPAGAVTRAELPPQLQVDPEAPQGHSGRAVSCRLEIDCFGLFGPAGVLPQHYTALVVERLRRFRDQTLRDFLDIFNQRAVSLLYRAWAKYRPAVQLERTAIRGGKAEWDQSALRPRDSLTAAVACLVGLGERGLVDRLGIDDEVVFHQAGHFARFPRSAESLAALLESLFDVAVEVRQFVGRWLVLEPPDQTQLGTRWAPDGLNTVLGGGAIAGRRVWNMQSVVELAVGPVPFATFRRLLPGTVCLGRLTDLTRLYVGPSFDIRVRPMLLAAEVPMARLGRHGPPADEPGAGSRLGWTTFMRSRPAPCDRDDAVFESV